MTNGSQKTRAAIDSEITTLLATNGTGAITASILQGVLGDINQSADITLTDNTLIVGLVAGSGAGSVNIYPATTANGYFSLASVNNTGNFKSTLSNANIGQATVYSLPDPGAATANILCDAGAQTVSGQKTFVAPILGAATATTLATGSVTLSNAAALQTDTTNAHTATLSAYYTTGTVYEAQATLTNGTSPTLAIAPSTHGAVTIDGATIGGTTACIAVKGTLITSASHAITAVSNAATCPITTSTDTVTNSSAATLTITMTTGAADGQIKWVRVIDATAASQTITWVNTENGEGTVPAATSGTVAAPKTAMFMYNGASSKWRCIIS